MMAHVAIIARRENRPPNLPRKPQVCTSLASEFYDAEHWAELAAKHLSRYTLPEWDVPCDSLTMARWLDRLDLSVRDFLRIGNYQNLQDYIDLNPDWPLRAWLGLMLEMADEHGA